MSPDASLPASLGERIVRYAPTAGFVLAIVLGGFIGSLVARRIVAAVVRRSGLEAFAERAGVARALYALGIKQGLAKFLWTLVYAAGLAVTFTAASDAMGLTVVSNLTTNLLRYLPRLLGAGAMLIGAGILASVVRAAVERLASKRPDVESPKAAAKVAHAIVILVGVMLAAEQAGVEIGFLTTLLQIGVGVLGVGLALAFALGFYVVIRNMAARHYYKPLLQVGDVVRIGEDEGTVLRFGPTALVLRTPEGDRIVPCSRFLHHTVIVRSAIDTPDRR
jgi:Conserved TM helix/Mechanosensitive ion channel